MTSLFQRQDPSAPDFNMAALLEDHASIQPDALGIAVGRKGDFVEANFAELNHRANAYAHALKAQGIKQGDRVILMIRDPQTFFAVVFACSKLGVIYVLIDPGMGVAPMLACIEEQKPDALIGIAKAHILKTVKRKAFSSLKKAFIVDGSFFPGAISLDKKAKAFLGQSFTREGINSHDDAAIMYTSGSTGIPKGVVFSHAMMGGQCRAIADMFDLGPGQKHVACFPLFALIAGSIGMGCVVPEMDLANPASADPQKIENAFLKYEAQSAFGSPSVWEPLSHHLEKNSKTLPSLRAAMTAGAPVQPALHARLSKALPKGDIYTPYGATEALPIAFTSGSHVLKVTAQQTAKGAGTFVGKAVPGVSVRIIGIDHAALPDLTQAKMLPRGEIGEIIVQGPLISKVYDKRPEHTAKAKIQDGDGFWHRMGDVGYLDDEGGLWFCGRMKHRVVRGDETFYSIPVEAIFENHDEVKRAALTWLGQMPNQTPVVCVELRGADENKTLRELRELAKSHDVTASIEHVLVHPDFPTDRRHNAKIERAQLAVFAQKELSTRGIL